MEVLMAQDLNGVQIIGRLTRDAEIKYFGQGGCKASLSIAHNKKEKKNGEWKEVAHYFDIDLFGKIAEVLKPSLVKGTQIGVTGELDQERWESNGQKHSRVKIKASSIQLFGGKKQGEANYNNANQEPVYESDYNDSDFPESIPF